MCVQEEDDYENKAGSTQGRRAWDDEFVLKRQFLALIPAFDPRPGRTNINQTQDFSIPAPGSTEASQSEVLETVAQPKLALFLRGPSQPGVCTVMLFMDAVVMVLEHGFWWRFGLVSNVVGRINEVNQRLAISTPGPVSTWMGDHPENG